MLIQLARLSNDPKALFTLAVALCVAFVIGIAFHEFSHALTAYLLGDYTAQALGRLTLNPLAHLDPTGTLLLVVAGFGWGKPTPVNPNRLRNGPRAGMAIVSAAGPVSNFTMAALFALPIKLGFVEYGGSALSLWSFGNYVWLLLFYVVTINILLGLFNLIPIAPLDGSKIAIGIFPGPLGDFFKRIEPYGPGILFALFALSFFSPELSIFNRIIQPLQVRLLNSFLG